MDNRQMQTIPTWKLSTYTFFFLLDTVFRAVWRRKGKGARGLICYPWLMLKCITGVLACYFLLTRRFRLILSAYAWFRRVDDIMDGDAKPPQGFTRESYLSQKREVILSIPFLDKCPTPFLSEDLLLVHLLREQKKHGIDVTQEVINLWSVMCWDDERRSRETPSTKDEMIYYATLQDCSILEVCVKTCDGNSQRISEITSLLAGIFTRTDWLSDFVDDIQQGIINIPAEAMSEHTLDPLLVRTCKSWEDLQHVPGFLSWYAHEIQELDGLWARARIILGRNFGNVLTSRLLSFIFNKLIVEGFEHTFKNSKLRVSA